METGAKVLLGGAVVAGFIAAMIAASMVTGTPPALAADQALGGIGSSSVPHPRACCAYGDTCFAYGPGSAAPCCPCLCYPSSQEGTAQAAICAYWCGACPPPPCAGACPVSPPAPQAG